MAYLLTKFMAFFGLCVLIDSSSLDKVMAFRTVGPDIQHKLLLKL